MRVDAGHQEPSAVRSNPGSAHAAALSPAAAKPHAEGPGVFGQARHLPAQPLDLLLQGFALSALPLETPLQSLDLLVQANLPKAPNSPEGSACATNAALSNPRNRCR